MTWDEQARLDADAAVWSDPGDGVAESLEWIGVLPEGRVLDLGCGVGRVSVPYALAHPQSTVWGVDSSAEMIARAERNLAAACCGNVVFRLVDGADLGGVPVLAAAWSMLVFQHLGPVEAAGYVRQVAGRMRPGGVFRLQFVDAAMCGPDDVGPLSRPHHRVTVRGWFEDAGFDVLDVDVKGMRPTWTWMTGCRR